MFEAAVIVPVPVAWAVTSPPGEMVATGVPPAPVPETLQVTGVLLLLPSLNVPTANIWTVLPTLPVKSDGETGPTAREDTVGFTKHPRQLIATARVVAAPPTP